jgi:hypothetical protein
MSTAVPSTPTAVPQGLTDPPVFHVSNQSARQAVVNSIRRSLIGRLADRYNDKSRNLLQQYISLLPDADQILIRDQFDQFV